MRPVREALHHMSTWRWGRWYRGGEHGQHFDVRMTNESDRAHGPRLVPARRRAAMEAELLRDGIEHRITLTYTTPEGDTIDGTALERRSRDGEKRWMNDFRDLDGNLLPWPPPEGASYDITTPGNDGVASEAPRRGFYARGLDVSDPPNEGLPR